MRRSAAEKALVGALLALVCLPVADGAAMGEEKPDKRNLFRNPSFERWDSEGRPALDEEVARARELLEVPTDVVESLTKYTDSDGLVRGHRDAVARSIETLSRSKGATE